jgi:hypothetical protein
MTIAKMAHEDALTRQPFLMVQAAALALRLRGPH